MSEIIYLTACPGGQCELTKDQIKRASFDGSRKGKMCKEHKGLVTKRKRNCPDCEKDFIFDTYGKAPDRCPACAKTRHAEMKNRRYLAVKSVISTTHAKKKIIAAGLLLKPGIYNFYKCGHVSHHTTREATLKLIDGFMVSCCQVCENPTKEKSGFLVKFKLYDCGCGEVGEKLTPMNKCKKHSSPKNISDYSGWSIDKRGDYCSGVMACKIMNSLNCDGCKTYIPIIKGIDPEIRGYAV
jgi:hypothetical protein